MKNLLLLLALAGILAAGCDPNNDQSAPVTTKEEPAKLDDPAKTALLPRMSQIALQSNGDWDSLPQDQKQPFLDFHNGKEEGAKKHYVELHRTEQENAANPGS